jgi:hypothetical protein
MGWNNFDKHNPKAFPPIAEFSIWAFFAKFPGFPLSVGFLKRKFLRTRR